jgi:DNA-binding Xre family transcriptional regulator
MVAKVSITKLLANRINELRIGRKWSYTDMALACGIERSQAHKICTIGLDLRLTTLEKISAGFNTSLSDLLNV